MVNVSKKSFNEILNNFDPNDSVSSSYLKEILNSYPFFQLASAYYLKSLKKQGKETFEKLLPKTAILTHNRSVLRKWIFSEEESKNDISNNITKHSFLDWFDVINDDKENVDEKIDLIARFIKNSPKIIFDKEFKSEKNLMVESKMKDELVTETLAKIYISQEKYKKAIKAYEILSLKYPKKSSLFADQIKSIKNLKKSKN